MKKLFCILSLHAALAGSLFPAAQAAISVGPGGSGTITFNALPAPAEWSTLLNGGGSADIADAAGLDAAVGTNDATVITTILGSTATTAPAISSSSIARWNSALTALQTVPTTAGYVSLMATLRNDTGANQSALTLSYDLTENHATGGTNANAVVEEVPGHRVYFSLNGAPGTWMVIPEISSVNTTGTRVGTANLGSWPNGSPLYLLWADDNAAADRNNTNNEEGGYLIDNVTFRAGTITSVVPVGASGSGTTAFNTYPTVLDGWYTTVIAGAVADIADTAALDAAVQTNDANAIVHQVGNSATVAPSISANALARWNTALEVIETVPTGVGYTVLMAKLQNTSGAAQSTLSIAYDSSELHADGTTVVEEVPGHRVFHSFTGAPGSWTLIPELSAGGSPGTLLATLDLGSWPAGGLLYVLWADDNAVANRDNANNEEGGYTIDNVVFSFSSISGVTIASPTAGQTFPQGVPVPISALAILPGLVTDVSFFDGESLIGSDSASPFGTVLSNAPLGAHILTAQATDDQGNVVTSPSVSITIVPNVPPTVTVTNPVANAVFEVGSNIVCQARAADTDGSVARVEFYADGALLFTDTTSPYSFEWCNVTGGAHTLTVVAVDNAGFRGTNTHGFSANTPAGVSVLIPNGSTWRYLDDGSDPDVFWSVPGGIDDSVWSSGVAELGYGDAAGNNRPERTVLNFGPDANAKFPTTYFRKTFNVSDPTIFGALTLRVLRDDGAIVYINGTEVFRTGITNEFVDYLTYTPPAAADDGTIYQVTNVEASVLQPGENLVAVEMHQDSGNSSDISFDLMLWGQGPTLSVSQVSATQVDIAWPLPSTGFVLEGKADLGAGAWSRVTAADAPADGFHHVQLNAASGMRFFRLRRP